METPGRSDLGGGGKADKAPSGILHLHFHLVSEIRKDARSRRDHHREQEAPDECGAGMLELQEKVCLPWAHNV